MFQSPKTGLYYFHTHKVDPKTKRVCFNPLKRVYAFLTKKNLFLFTVKEEFQSPKTGLCFSHSKEGRNDFSFAQQNNVSIP